MDANEEHQGDYLAFSLYFTLPSEEDPDEVGMAIGKFMRAVNDVFVAKGGTSLLLRAAVFDGRQLTCYLQPDPPDQELVSDLLWDLKLKAGLQVKGLGIS